MPFSTFPPCFLGCVGLRDFRALVARRTLDSVALAPSAAAPRRRTRLSEAVVSEPADVLAGRAHAPWYHAKNDNDITVSHSWSKPQIQTGAKREQPSRIRTVVDLGHVVDRGWPNVLAAFDP
jgi:hypothetical protein